MTLIMALVFGGLCAAFASSKGRSSLGWFVWGFFFGILALIVLAFLSSLPFDDSRER